MVNGGIVTDIHLLMLLLQEKRNILKSYETPTHNDYIYN